MKYCTFNGFLVALVQLSLFVTSSFVVTKVATVSSSGTGGRNDPSAGELPIPEGSSSAASDEVCVCVCHPH